MVSAAEAALLAFGMLSAVCQALENTTSVFSAPPVAAAVRSHFDKCPDGHAKFCFHGTCRYLVQEEKPTCVCYSGFVGSRCEHVDLLAVVAANHKKQTLTLVVVVSVIASVALIVVCVLIFCCGTRQHCEWCRTIPCRQEKPNGLLKGGTSCCSSETGL
ncbi:protransforming growth factor alpha isoform X2 [Varanus komodoensis]|uniref:protransforming growth factor alpha isoform X2 n=1 Tax=Varanus komodoensis TaxID=61221 RepID=UPI001CF7CB76|nr:protransforming growth factor alpha isoform X2 [Varanus komodoensis]